jgi:hypothetical protein
MRLGFSIVAAAVVLAACASSAPQVSIAEAARAECERMEVSAENMQSCIDEREALLRAARDLQRAQPRDPPPQNPF